MTSTTTIAVPDRNEIKFLFALGFSGVPIPTSPLRLEFRFVANEELFEARRAYSLNHAVPVLDLIAASRHVDELIHAHRKRNGGGHGR